MMRQVLFGLVILSGFQIAPATVAADPKGEVNVVSVAPTDVNAPLAPRADAIAQAARFAIDYGSLLHQARTNENATRGFFLLSSGSLLSGSALQGYGADLHELLDQLGEDHFSAILLSSPVPVRDGVLRVLGSDAGYDDPETDTSDFARFYPVLDRMIRSAHRESNDRSPTGAGPQPSAVAPSQASDAKESARVNNQEAIAEVAGLTEVQAYGRALIHRSAGSVKATIFCESDNGDGQKSDNSAANATTAGRICIYVGEEHGDHTVCWKHFRVSPQTREIEVWSEEKTNGWMHLSTWRADLAATRQLTRQASLDG